MSALREAAQQALDALEVATTPRSEDRQTVLKAQAALRKALAEPEQEPVAWMRGDGGHVDFHKHPAYLPLYTAPPQRKPLTDDEIRKLWDSHTIEVYGKIGINPVLFARYLEREYGIGEKE